MTFEVINEEINTFVLSNCMSEYISSVLFVQEPKQMQIQRCELGCRVNPDSKYL